jgi:hypothetical protein
MKMRFRLPPKFEQKHLHAVLTAAAMSVVTILAACTSSDLLEPTPLIDVGTTTASFRPLEPVPNPQITQPFPQSEIAAPVENSLPPENTAPVSVGYVPRLSLPQMENTGQGDYLPPEEIACRRELASWGASFQEMAPINDGGGCGIAHPIEFTGAGGGINISPSATVTCEMALEFTKWAREELAPAARLRYLTGVQTIHQGSSYSCRTIGNKRGGTLSEHASGNALDIMAITLKNGKYIDVHKPGFFSFRERGFLNAVRADACDYFSTVLGPGYNYDHRNHFHFDLMQRRSGHRACR